MARRWLSSQRLFLLQGGVHRPAIEGLEPGTAATHGDALAMPPTQKVTPEVQKEILKRGGNKQMDLFEGGGEDTCA